MLVNDITGQIVQAAVQVHRTLGGPGLLESVYEEALVWELNHRGLYVDRQLQIAIIYKGQQLASFIAPRYSCRKMGHYRGQINHRVQSNL